MNRSAPASSSHFASFADFYPFYLSEHRHPVSRRLHFFGTAIVLTIPLIAFAVGNPWLLFAIPVAGYGFAWAGHFFFEGNRPATFSHPLYSLAADFVLFRDILVGRIRF